MNTIMYDLPLSQSVPTYPKSQVHVYLFTSSKHFPPCRQGRLAHSLKSRMKTKSSVYCEISSFCWNGDTLTAEWKCATVRS